MCRGRALFGICAVALVVAACATSPSDGSGSSSPASQAPTTTSTTTKATTTTTTKATTTTTKATTTTTKATTTTNATTTTTNATTTTTKATTTTTKATTTTTKATTTTTSTTTTTTTTIPTQHNGQVWVFGDSRCVGGQIYGNTSFTGWCSYLLDVPSGFLAKNFGFNGIGFTQNGKMGSIRQWFDLVKAPRGWPSKVYISAGVNDAGRGIDASPEIRDFRDYLAAHGVVQVWGTAPYVGPNPAWQSINNLVAAMNRTVLSFGKDPTSKMIRVGDCAGPNPNPSTQDGVHPTNLDAARFRTCMSAAGNF